MSGNVTEEKLISVAHKMVHGDSANFWRGEAGPLIESGMNLQAMDVRLSIEFEMELGALSDEEINTGIAEFHRQLLEVMGKPVPDRNLDPDPLRLPKIHRRPPHRGTMKLRGDQRYQWSEQEIDELMVALKKKRPELIRNIELWMEDWVAAGRPDRHHDEPGGYSAMAALDAFVLDERPDIQTLDADGGWSPIWWQIRDPYFET